VFARVMLRISAVEPVSELLPERWCLGVIGSVVCFLSPSIFWCRMCLNRYSGNWKLGWRWLWTKV